LDLPRPLLYDRDFYDQQAAGSLASARVVLEAFFALAPIASVVDVGCGVGPWVRTALDLGAANSIGLDGGYVDRANLLIEPDRFQACDLETENLRQALPEDRAFDAALCMEVAEHLSPARAASFVAELCLLADLVLFSAAVPGQGGTNHINEQWPEYWSQHFAASGFDCFDVLRFKLWHAEACEWWYIQNALVFARQDSAAWHALAQAAAPTRAPMPLVHPRKLAQLVKNEISHGIMNRSLKAEHANAMQSLQERAAALERQLRADIDGLTGEVGRLTDKIGQLTGEIERREAEREATFEATRQWMLRIESEQAAEHDLAQKQLAAARAALTTVQQQLATALSAHQQMRRNADQLRAQHHAEHHAQTGLLSQYKAQVESLSIQRARAEAEAEALRAQVNALYASTSWRITAPMRALRRARS
jgi:SAM-dependent methyltransferase